MFSGAKLETVTNGEMKHYRDCLAAIQCNPPRTECFLDKCDECPGTSDLRDRLETYFEDNMIDQIEYKQWTTTDRSTLETKIQTVDDFLDSFMATLRKLLRHDFIAKQQSHFLQHTKANMEPGEILVIADFAENYSFVVQDAAQSFHWNNLQATIHPFVCYFQQEGKLNEHLSFVVISDCNTHDTVAVHLFQKLLLQFLTNKIESFKKILYFSDGCAAQYKNLKNFINLCHHEEDFGVPADWHFFATSHGKGPSDGIGGTVKRLAARASLQRPLDQQIMTPWQLYEFATSQIKSIDFAFATTEQYKNETDILRQRFQIARTIPGTQKLHCFCPMSRDKIKVRDFSSSSDSREEPVCLQVHGQTACIDFADIKGYVTVMYDCYWWLACVQEILPASQEVELSFLHPHGPSPSFKFPYRPDTLVIHGMDVLTAVEPVTETGRIYKISAEEMNTATQTLVERKMKVT
ncbi:uncharacterized protein LOC119727986 [Patiria miniata]|uniref:Cc8L18.2-like protein n=1 Tax=Patiria miniata TaxID=46514 RepID=A0A913ZXG8_PATMI|nr:uncharacterized protein LOC119727986 [Patiria miniata]